jgi:hypothetical protein
MEIKLVKIFHGISVGAGRGLLDVVTFKTSQKYHKSSNGQN